MQPLKADTQAIIMLGPAVDKTDGVTLEAGLVAAMDASGGIRISKNGGAWADRAATVVATVYDEGWYQVTLKTGDVDTEGTLDVMYEDATTCLPMMARFQVVNANVYDSLFAAATTDYLQTDAIQISGDATAADNLELSAAQIIPFTVDTVTNTHTPTTTEFQADDITEATADHFNGRLVIWSTGVLAGQATSISDYVAVGGIGQFTVVALTEAPNNNDTGYVI